MQINPRMLEKEFMVRCKLHDCGAACCIYGVWIDVLEADRILKNAHIILPEMSENRRDTSHWFDGREDLDEHMPSGRVVHSRVVDNQRHYGGTECVFLRSDHKCALQTAAVKAGLHPWALKPFYCVLHPLDLDEKGRITLDDAGLMLDEPGSCLRPSIVRVSLLETFEPELRFFLGDQAYEELLLLVP
ncbi:MAG: DUF3109 family protein [Leptolinea sp.]|nr:DUF3109 family protein [Leptolinea sp.]